MREGGVDVWRIPLGPGREWSDLLSHLLSRLLSNDERARAARFKSADDRRRFVIAHAATQEILKLTEGLNDIRFNLTHSRDLAVVAVTRGSRIGVDIEFRHRSNVLRVAERLLSASEAARLNEVAPASRVDALLDCWTRKEAYLKAIGLGLTVPLTDLEVSFGPGSQPALLHVAGRPDEASCWRLYSLDLGTEGTEYRGALAVEGRLHTIHYADWPPEAAATRAGAYAW